METFAIEIVGDLLILRADGGLNAGTGSQLSEHVATLVKGGVTKIIVDCSQLEIVSSMGLSALLLLHTRIKRVGGEVKLCAVKGAIVQVIHMTNLDRIFGIYPSIEEARLAFRSAS